MKWKRSNITIDEPIVDYLEKLFDAEIAKGYDLKISVGTDSQKVGRSYKFATVILITTSEDLGGVIVGRGGVILSATYFNEFKQKNKELVEQIKEVIKNEENNE